MGWPGDDAMEVGAADLRKSVPSAHDNGSQGRAPEPIMASAAADSASGKAHAAPTFLSKMQTQTPPQTCTGCRKQKNSEDFWRYNRTNLTCNACSERHRTRKAKTAAAAAQQNQPQPPQNQGQSQQQAQQAQQPSESTLTSATTTTKQEQD
ncbi:hypothetical protein D0869_04025 [Hortaea werneckii]|uniref:GATA-type domain-containing protein n=1 Tax=Hortaea werneckii TaxID=91943 RepID=A0A3M6X384_HORWE|nr:hypothetical protein D0869_04025 [Hortaea werneckii]